MSFHVLKLLEGAIFTVTWLMRLRSWRLYCSKEHIKLIITITEIVSLAMVVRFKKTEKEDRTQKLLSLGLSPEWHSAMQAQ